jgi:hypothetical protein
MDNLLAILFAGNRGSGVSPCSMSPFAKFLDTPQPADLGPGPRTGVLSERQLGDNLAEAFKGTKLLEQVQQLVRALVLLWHDHLDAAHTLAQAIEHADGSYVHAIMHRREPDYGNSAYWFRRVSRHSSFPELGRRVNELLDSKGNSTLKQMLQPKGEWDPFAFVDACEQAASGAISKEHLKVLLEIQRIEFQVLLDSIVGDDVRRL